MWIILSASTTTVQFPQTVYEPELQLPGGQGRVRAFLTPHYEGSFLKMSAKFMLSCKLPIIQTGPGGAPVNNSD